jgi:hypothetical protein
MVRNLAASHGAVFRECTRIFLGGTTKVRKCTTKQRIELDAVRLAPKKPASAYLGLGAIVCLGGLATFSAAEGGAFAVGYSLTQLATSGMMTLPLFLSWRFGTRSGRTSPLSTAFNVFAFGVVGIWLLFFVVAKFRLEGLATSPPKFEPEPVSHSTRAPNSDAQVDAACFNSMFADLIPRCASGPDRGASK